MPAERYYHPELFKEDQQILLKDKEYHHLIHVMRTRIGEQVEVVNGIGQLAEAFVESLEKKHASLHLKSVLTVEPPAKKMILAQGIPRMNRLELITEKGTELGMTELWLFPGARSEKKEISENQYERLTFLTIAAMKQCGRLFLPKIKILPSIKQWKDLDISSFFFGDLSPKALPFSTVWKTLKLTSETGFCIGPESGFSPEETTLLEKMHAHGVLLHPNVLTTDTAAIAALALLGHHLDYFNPSLP